LTNKGIFLLTTDLTNSVDLPAQKPTRHWWLAIGLIVTVAGALRFTGFTFGLPYFENFDEPWFFYEAAFRRGLLSSWAHPNPSQGLIGIYKLLQIGAEIITGHSSLLYAAEITTVLRFISVLISLLTLVFIGLCARELAGDRAGWLAAAGWAVIPLVIYHSFIAIAEPWMMLLAALALYMAAATLRRGGWLYPLLSVWAGLAAFSFKYSMFSFAGIGLAAALWKLWSQWPRQGESGAGRAYWLRIMALQVFSIVVFLAVLVLFGGLIHDINNPSREVAQFVQNPLARATDPHVIAQVVYAGFWQLNTTTLVFVALYILVSWLIARQASPLRRNWLLAAWIGFGLLGLFNMLLIPFYFLYDGTLLRYLFSTDLVFMILAASALMFIYKALIARLKRPGRQIGLRIGTAVVIALWLGPLTIQSIHDAGERTKSYTYTDMTVWASNTMAPGGILADFLGHRAFTHEFGGYTGPYRIWSYTLDPLSKSPQDWIKAGYNYMEMTSDQVQTALQSAAGQAFFKQILLLRQFPPADTRQTWQGPTFNVYQLNRPQQAVDYRFGEGIHLVGVDGLRPIAAPGESLSLSFYWQAAQTPPDNYSMFVHFVPTQERNHLLAQVDGAPGPSGRPTLTWTEPAETLVSAPLTMTIPKDLLPGDYNVWVGLYSVRTGQRLPTDTGTDRLLMRITVAAPF
jgi:hypothetical protein